jgi:histone deacetylase 1/2
MEKIAMDYKGPFPVQSYHHCRGFYLFSDRASNYVVAYPVRAKTELYAAATKFYINEIRRHKHVLSVIQCDADTVNLSTEMSEWIRDRDIRIQHSPPHVHSKNGQIERDMQSVMDKARTMMASYNVPSTYWEFAVQCACYCINRSPTSNHEKTPYEMVTGEKPDVSKLVPFYAPGVFHVTKEERGGKAWSYKAEPCRMLGYSTDCAGAYLVLSLRTRAVLERSNCVFDTDLRAEDIPLLHPEYEESDNECDEYADRNWYDVEERDPKREDESEVESNSSDETSADVTTQEGSASEFDAFMVDRRENHYQLSCHAHWLADVYNIAQPVMLPENPRSLEEALQLPDGEEWRRAVQKEIEAFEVRGTWGPAEQSGRAMKTKLILKYSLDNEFQLKRKARIVVCGYSQIKGIDYHDTYSPTTTTPVVFMLLHIANVRGYALRVFDVSAAYLEGQADVQMFARLPAAICDGGKSTRVEILGNWYGEKQAGRIWHCKFDKILVSMGFRQCPMTPCLYVWTRDRDVMLLSVHVDDGLMVGNNESLFAEFLATLLKHVRHAVMSETPRKFLGMELIPQEDGRIMLRQQQYIDDHFDEFAKRVRTPMSNLTNLRKELPNPENESLQPVVGQLRWLADRTRPDLLASVGELSRGGEKNPSDMHLQVSTRIRNFITSTREAGMILGGKDEPTLFAYCDASYVTDGDAKCRLGGAIFLGTSCGAIDSFSRTTTCPPKLRRKSAALGASEAAEDDGESPEGDTSTISHSSTEAEIKAIDETLRLVEYWLEVLDFIGEPVKTPVKIFVDNKSAIELCRVLKTTHAVKHVNMRIRYIHERISSGMVGLFFVPSELNVADILTKALSIDLFEKHSKVLRTGHGGETLQFLESQAVNFLDYKEE